MAQAFRANRRNRAMSESLSSAFNIGSQPQQQRNNAIVVPTQNRKRFTPVTKDGTPAEAGKYWYNELNNVPVPTVYIYEQPLVWDTHAKRFDGSLFEFVNGIKLKGLGPLLQQDKITLNIIVPSS